MTVPTVDEETALFETGYKVIAGIDEVGRGALAGPVLAAAVILPRDFDYGKLLGVRDSKELTKSARGTLSKLIQREAVAVGIGIIDHTVIDEINILNATRQAMYKAVEALACYPDYVLIDAMKLPKLKVKQKSIIKGDKYCFSIACASILAKVARDAIMVELHEKYPHYGFKNNKGYGTAEHLKSLTRLGPCAVHRMTFAPVKETRRLI